MTNTLTTIPLGKLVHSAANVRKTDANVSIDELAANIETLGVLQTLTVRPALKKTGKPNGTFEVLAGGRRLSALKLLAKKRRIPKDYPVPCQIRKEGDATELSLAENAVREALHPADQFDAFKKLHAEGLGADEIAARFGVTPLVVRQRLKLASVSPKLIKCYRAGEMTLEQLMAFTITDDTEAQERVWFEGPYNDEHPRAIRRALTSSHVDGSDRRAQFVGAEAYEAAGGEIVRDLFRPDDLGYFTDSALLEQLAVEKLAKEAEAIKTEGWLWVEAYVQKDYEGFARLGRLQPVSEPRSVEDKARLSECTTRYDALIEEHGESPSDDVLNELEALAEEIDTLSQPVLTYKEEGKARAGAIVSLDYHGDPTIDRGLVRPEDRTDREKKKRANKGKVSGKNASDNVPALSEALQEELSAFRTAALQETLAGNPAVALDALVYTLAIQCFYEQRAATCLDVKPMVHDARRITEVVAESSVVVAFSQRQKRWQERLPGAEELWSWVIAQNRKIKLELLACCVAMTVNAIRSRHDSSRDERLAQSDVLATTLNLDMSKWWTPTKERYFSRVSKPLILAVVAEAVTPQAAENIASMKKAAMEERADELMSGRKWLPEPLRTPEPKTEAVK